MRLNMQKHKKLSDLFIAEPRQWGLRGDPHLWHEMKSRVDDLAYPQTDEQFTQLFEELYHQLIGASLHQTEPVFVERYSQGGMSSGYVSPEFWWDRALPLLLERYRASKAD